MVTSNARFTPAGKPALLKLTGVHGPKVEPKGDPGHCLAWINITHRGVNGKEHIMLIHRVNPTDGLALGLLPKDVRGRTVVYKLSTPGHPLLQNLSHNKPQGIVGPLPLIGE